MGLLAGRGLLEKAKKVVGDTAQVASAIRVNGTEQALASLLGEVGLFENTLGRVDVREI